MNAPETLADIPAYANGHLRQWCREREVNPWPVWWMGDRPLVKDLYAAYVASCDSVGLRALTMSTFGKALIELGYEPHRYPEGMRYAALTVMTRRERAEAEVLQSEPTSEQAYDRVFDEAMARHMEKVDHGFDVKTVPGDSWEDGVLTATKREVRLPVPATTKSPSV